MELGISLTYYGYQYIKRSWDPLASANPSQSLTMEELIGKTNHVAAEKLLHTI